MKFKSHKDNKRLEIEREKLRNNELRLKINRSFMTNQEKEILNEILDLLENKKSHKSPKRDVK